MTSHGKKVALVHMPFADPAYPSLGLSLLKAALAQVGIAAKVHYFNLEFTKYVDNQLYLEIVRGAPRTFDLAGEWVFAEALWGPDQRRDEEYIRQVLHGAHRDHAYQADANQARQIEKMVADLLDCRAQVTAFLDYCVNSHDWTRYRIVGFSSSFQQQLASLALARRLKDRFPDLFIVFGGANVEGVMGHATFRAFPFIDAVCSGEGDVVFPELVLRQLAGQSFAGLSGISQRRRTTSPQIGDKSPQFEENLSLGNATLVTDLDGLPVPDFDDYFLELLDERLSWIEPRLVFETSRGCWWGQKSHCTFCGLNANSMAFRHKSSDRAANEISLLLSKFGTKTRSFIATDNIIPHQYYKNFLPALAAAAGTGASFFYETKANLSKEVMKLMHAAGIKEIQPGIESLATPVLKIMKKGVTALQNIQLLKWCRELGITPIWNFLVGFPGEMPEYYDGLEELVLSITHLTPPSGVTKLRFDRFSPYLNSPDCHGLREVRPYAAYNHIYPGLAVDLVRDLAYYFVAQYNGCENIDSYTYKLRNAVAEWNEHYAESNLFVLPMGEHLLVYDSRPKAEEGLIKLGGLERLVYEACDNIVGQSTISERISVGLGLEITDGELCAALASLRHRRLVIEEEGKYLNIGVPLTIPTQLDDTLKIAASAA